MPFDRKANRRRYYLEHQAEAIAYSRKTYQANKEKYSRLHKDWCSRHKEEIKQYRRTRYATDKDYRINHILRSRFKKAVMRCNREASLSFLGCELPFFKDYIQKKFKEGMTWDNWSYTGWHLDHIKPLSSFDLTNKKEIKKAFHYSNLQPLWMKENMTKSKKHG